VAKIGIALPNSVTVRQVCEFAMVPPAQELRHSHPRNRRLPLVPELGTDRTPRHSRSDPSAPTGALRTEPVPPPCRDAALFSVFDGAGMLGGVSRMRHLISRSKVFGLRRR
jgi:hypothetical protein